MATKEKEKALHIYPDRLGIDGEVHFDEFIQLIASAVLQMMRSARENIVEQVIKESKEVVDRGEVTKNVSDSIYDAVNLAFSNVLAMFAPEYEKHPSLSEAAIMKAENEIIEAAAGGDKDAITVVTGKEPTECEEVSDTAPDVEQN